MADNTQRGPSGYAPRPASSNIRQLVKPVDIFLAVSVPIIWGGGFLFAKVAIEHFPPILLMAFTFTLTALILVWFVPRPARVILWRIFWVAIVSAAIQYSLTFTGLRDLDASTAILVVQLEVPFGVIMASIFLKDHLGLRRVLGIALAFVGVAVIAGEPRLQERYGRCYWKKAMVRDSMLSRAGASGGLVGSSKAVCGAKRARPSTAESKHLNTSASLRCI